MLVPEASRARRHPPLQAQYGLPQTPNVIDTLAPRDAGGERPGPEGAMVASLFLEATPLELILLAALPTCPLRLTCP